MDENGLQDATEVKVDNVLDMDTFEYDPYTAALPTTVAKLIYNAYEQSSEEYNEKSGKPAVPQWVMTFEDGLFQDWNDPTKARTLYNRVNVAYWRGVDTDDQELVKHKGGSTPAKFIAECDKEIDFHPRNEALIGHWFRVVRMEFGTGDFVKKLWVPQEDLGTDPPAEVIKAEIGRTEKAAGGSWA